MNDFVFQSPTKVSFGEGLCAAAFESIVELGGKKPLLITDKFLLDNGLADVVLRSLEAAGHKPLIFSDVPPDSDLHCVNEASKVARDNACDSFIAFGGGSVIDTCKAVNICVSLGGELEEHQGLNVIDTKLYPLVVIPTTAGTGSEVSFVAMIKDKETVRKLVFGSRFIAPDVALLDPLALVSLPPRLTAATGMDAITHNLECMAAAITSSPFTDGLALESLRLLFKYLPIATKNGEDIEARGATLVASTMAGAAFTNAGVGIVHALAHATGAKFNTHHGMTNAVYLPHGMRFNLDTCSAIYAEIGRALGFSSDLDNNKASGALIEKVENLLIELELPRDLRSLGVPKMDEEDMSTWVSLVLEDPAILFNPSMASEDDIKEIFERAY